jgi:hypothetical protein
LPSQVQIDKVSSSEELPGPTLVGIHFARVLLPECDLRYKRVNVVSSRIRLRVIAAEDEVQ